MAVAIGAPFQTADGRPEDASKLTAAVRKMFRKGELVKILPGLASCP